MKVNEIISENRIDENPGAFLKGAWNAGTSLFKKKPAGLLPTNKAKTTRAALRANRNAGAKALQGLTGSDRQKMIAKIAMQDAKILAAAEQSMKNLVPIEYVIKGLAIGALILEYKAQAKFLEAEYNKYLADRESSVYATMDTKEKAYALYLSDHDLALGKLSTEIGIIIINAPVAKLLKLVTGKWGMLLAGVLGGAAGAGGGTGGAVAGAAAGIALSAGARKFLVPFLSGKAVDAATKAAVIAFFESNAGKEYLSNSLVGEIVENIGAAVRVTLDGAGKALASYNGWGSSITKPVGQAMSGAVTPNVAAPELSQAEKDREAANAKVPYNLQSWEENGVLFVGGKQVTDNKGKLLPGLKRFIDDTNLAAKQLRVPSPLAKIAVPANYGVTAY